MIRAKIHEASGSSEVTVKNKALRVQNMRNNCRFQRWKESFCPLRRLCGGRFEPSLVFPAHSHSSTLLFVFGSTFYYPLKVMYWLCRGQGGRGSLRGPYPHCSRELICYLLVERWCAYPLALSETKCKFVCSRSPKSERAISGCALLSQRVFCKLRPSTTTTLHLLLLLLLLPACLLSWHGRVRALQAARSFSCILRGCHKTRWAPFNPISEIHSDVGKRAKKKESEIKFFISPPVRHLPISLEVREWHQLMTVGRRRHQHWHKNSMFQASGGIMQGLLLYRR